MEKLNFQQPLLTRHVIPQKYFAQETFLIIINADVYYMFFWKLLIFSGFFDEYTFLAFIWNRNCL